MLDTLMKLLGKHLEKGIPVGYAAAALFASLWGYSRFQAVSQKLEAVNASLRDVKQTISRSVWSPAAMDLWVLQAEKRFRDKGILIDLPRASEIQPLQQPPYQWQNLYPIPPHGQPRSFMLVLRPGDSRGSTGRGASAN